MTGTEIGSAGVRDGAGVLVVGVDGSTNSATAFAWAVQEACRHGGRIRVVIAWHHSRPGQGASEAASGLRRQRAADAVQRVLEQVPHAAVDVRVEVLEGAASTILVESAAEADLLVVGTLGVEASRRVVLGSVSARCALHAPCPVVVVPSGWRAAGLQQHRAKAVRGGGSR